MEMKHQSEIMRLNEMLFMSKQKPETVVMLKFTYMEKQLAEMEARLTARENEYKSALQQSKFNSIKELKRLEKIHEEVSLLVLSLTLFQIIFVHRCRNFVKKMKRLKNLLKKSKNYQIIKF